MLILRRHALTGLRKDGEAEQVMHWFSIFHGDIMSNFVNTRNSSLLTWAYALLIEASGSDLDDYSTALEYLSEFIQDVQGFLSDSDGDLDFNKLGSRVVFETLIQVLLRHPQVSAAHAWNLQSSSNVLHSKQKHWCGKHFV